MKKLTKTWRMCLAFVTVVAILTTLFCVSGLSASAAATTLAMTGTSMELPLENFAAGTWNNSVIVAGENDTSTSGTQVKVDSKGNANGEILRLRLAGNTAGVTLSTNQTIVTGLTVGKTYTVSMNVWSTETLAGGNLWVNSITSATEPTVVSKLVTLNFNEVDTYNYTSSMTVEEKQAGANAAPYETLTAEFVADKETALVGFWMKNTSEWGRFVFIDDITLTDKEAAAATTTTTTTTTTATTTTTTTTTNTTTTTTTTAPTGTTTRTETYKTVTDVTAEMVSSKNMTVVDGHTGKDGMKLTPPDKETAAYISYKLTDLESGKYTVTAWVKSDGGFATGHFYANPGADSSTQITASLKDKIAEWTEVTIYDVEVTDGDMVIGAWLKGAVASAWIDDIQVKLVGTPSNDGDSDADAKEEEKPAETYKKVINLPFTSFTSVSNAKMKAEGYKNNTAMFIETQAEDGTAQAFATLSDLENGTYTVTAWVKTSGGFKSGHMVANPGSDSSTQVIYSLKEEIAEWTQIEIHDVSVTDGKLLVGVWVKGADEGQYVYLDDVKVKLVGKGNATGIMTYTKTVDIANTSLSTNAYTTLTAGGYKTKTKLVIGSDSEDYKGGNNFKVKDLDNGTYTLTAWVKSSGGHNLAHLFANTGSDSSTQIASVFTKWVIDDWTLVEVPGIKVTNGEVAIGLWVNSKAGTWVELDGVQLKKEGGEATSPNSGETTVPAVASVVAVMLSMGVAAVLMFGKKKYITAK